jgi:hypothetical protein
LLTDQYTFASYTFEPVEGTTEREKRTNKYKQIVKLGDGYVGAMTVNAMAVSITALSRKVLSVKALFVTLSTSNIQQ